MELKDGIDFSLDAETVILGTILRKRSSFGFVCAHFDAELLYVPAHIEIWKAIKTEIDAGRAYNADTIYNTLSAQEGKGAFMGIDDLLGYLRLTEDAGAHNPVLQIPPYVEILKECAIRRGLKAYHKEGLRLLNEDAEKMTDALNGAYRGLETIQHLGQRGEGFVSADDSCKALRTPAKVNRIVPTGFDALDNIGGFLREGLTLLGGRASMGKSAFLIEVARRAAMAGRRVDLFSMEMNREQIAARLLSSSIAQERFNVGSQSTLPYKAIYEERLNPEWVNLCDRHDSEIAKLEGLNICDRSRVTVSDIKGMCLAKRGQLDLVIIDYLNILSLADIDKTLRHDQKLGMVAHGLRAFAKETGAAVVLLCQLNRGNVNRDNRVPQLQDLRDSGELEQHADGVMFVHRESYYLKREIDGMRAAGQHIPTEKLLEYQDAENVMDVIVAKQRMGDIATAVLRADMPTNFIRDWSQSEIQNKARAA